jgi:Ribosomal protein L9, N-terminal domain
MSFASTALLNLVKNQPARSALQRVAPQQRQQWRCGHTVRIIVTQDVSDGKLYAGDIANVKAGYARNLLIPKKMAVYATRQNFEKLQIKDPDLETVEERQLRLAREAEAGDDKDLKAADLLKFYLRNKVVRVCL